MLARSVMVIREETSKLLMQWEITMLKLKSGIAIIRQSSHAKQTSTYEEDAGGQVVKHRIAVEGRGSSFVEDVEDESTADTKGKAKASAK